MILATIRIIEKETSLEISANTATQIRNTRVFLFLNTGKKRR